MSPLLCFFLTDTATTYIYTLSLHDALPICRHALLSLPGARQRAPQLHPRFGTEGRGPRADGQAVLPGHGRLDVPWPRPLRAGGRVAVAGGADRRLRTQDRQSGPFRSAPTSIGGRAASGRSPPH